MVHKQLFFFLVISAIVCCTTELAYSVSKHDGVYITKDTIANFITAMVGRFALKPILTAPILILLVGLYHVSPWRHNWSGPWSIALIIFLYDFVYYWKHRFSHSVRILWAFHSVHHSSETLNFLVAARETWLSVCYEWAFLGPLCLLGFPPELVLIGKTANIFYQFFIHSRYWPRLGPLELVVNTPSHHRVHHGKNVEYWDKNFGGILIVWDRLFGTFAVERAPVVYGITHPLNSFNVFTIHFRELFCVFRDAFRTRSISGGIAVLFSSPGAVPAPTVFTPTTTTRPYANSGN